MKSCIYNSVPSISTPDINLPSLSNIFESSRATEWKNHGHVQVRQGIREQITKMFDKLYFSITPFVDATAAWQLGIRCEMLSLVTFGGERHHEPFFKPRPSSWLVLHPADPEDRRTTRQMAYVDGQWDARTNSLGGDYSKTEMVSAALRYAFRCYARITPFEDTRSEDGARDCLDSYTLEEISGWVNLGMSSRLDKRKYMQPSPPRKLESSDEEPPDPKANISPAAFQWSRLADVWMRDDSKPHRIFMLEHATHAEEQLLRSEVLAILGMIRERLAGHTLREHKIAPVMLISCMKGFAARIIEAHYHSGELVLYKSDLYYFDTEGYREANVELFLLYLGSEPARDTVT